MGKWAVPNSTESRVQVRVWLASLLSSSVPQPQLGQGRIDWRGQSNPFISLTEMFLLWSSLTLIKGCWMEMSWDGRQ